MAAAVSEMRADAADVTTHAPETAALVEELSATCDRWSQWEEVAAVVLAHLTAAGRLVPAGGMTLTAEQVKDMRTVLGLNGSQDIKVVLDVIKVVLDAQARLRALFPATEPAEEERCDFYAETESGDARQCTRRDGHTAHHHIEPVCAEPTEAEARAGRVFPADAFGEVVRIGWATYYFGADNEWHNARTGAIETREALIKEACSANGDWYRLVPDTDSPTNSAPAEPPPRYCPACKLNVPPAPYCTNCGGDTIPRSSNETEWQRLNDVPPTVRKVKDVQGFQWVRRADNSEWLGCDGSYAVCRIGHPNLAPFVAAEEG
ncbi:MULTISPECIES: hypothetical protein [Streptomyces]